jgi:hypothetical protein
MGERFETCVTLLDSIGKNCVDGLNHLGRCRHSKSVLLKGPNVINPYRRRRAENAFVVGDAEPNQVEKIKSRFPVEDMSYLNLKDKTIEPTLWNKSKILH